MCGSGPDYIEENEYERALFEQSEKMWQNYQDKYIPLENQAIEQMQNKRSAGYRQHSMDQGVNAARMQNPGTTQVGAGMNPGGGGAMMAANDAANLTATSGAMGAMAGLQSAEDQYTSGMLGISQAGRGQQATAMQGMSSLAANQAGMDAAELAAKKSVKGAKWGALGTMAGAGTMAWGKHKGWWEL